MGPLSDFNDILGPVMRGPSSSHTAGSYHLGRLAASLLDTRPARASFTFDPDGSYAQTYSEQDVDLAFAAEVAGCQVEIGAAGAMAAAPEILSSVLGTEAWKMEAWKMWKSGLANWPRSA